MSTNSNGVGFEIFLKDNLSNPLQQASQKGVAALGKLESAKGNLATGANGLQSSLGGVAGGITKMLVPLGLLTAGIALLKSGLSEIIHTGSEFTKEMSNVKALSDASASDLKRLESTALSLGSTTAFSSKEVAAGFAEQFRAGLTVNQALQSIEGNLNLAAASQVGLSRATEIAISMMHQYGLEAKDNQRTVDVLALGNNMFATDLEQLADAMNYLGPTAHAFGVSLEESVAVYGALSNAGLRGSLATRALGTAIANLSKPTKPMAELMEQLNLKFFDAKGNFIGINNTIGVLTEKFKGFSQEQRMAAISTLFGAEAVQEFSILLNVGKDKLDEYEKKLQEASGTSKKMADEQLNNLSGDVKKFHAAVEGAQLKVFSSSEGFFRSLTQLGTALVQTFSDSWSELIQPFSDLNSLFDEILLILKDLGIEFRSASESTGVFSVFLWAVKWGLRAIVLPFQAVTWAVKELIITFGSLYKAGQTFAEKISAIFMPLGELFQGVFTLDYSKIKSGWSTLKSNLSNAVGDSIDVFKSEFNRLSDLYHPATPYEEKYNGTKIEATSGSDKLRNAAFNVSPKIETDVSGVSGAGKGGKSIIVTINNLIGEMKVNGNSITDLEGKIKDTVTRALIGAVNDFETSYN